MNVELSRENYLRLLKYMELVHDGKRRKTKERGIEQTLLKIRTDPLPRWRIFAGSQSIQERPVGKIFLNSEVKFTVRRRDRKSPSDISKASTRQLRWKADKLTCHCA